MAEEVAVADKLQQQTAEALAGIAEGLEATSPGRVAPVTGDGGGEPEGTSKEGDSEADATVTAELKELLAGLPANVREDVLADDLRAAEQRGRTRRDEMEMAVTSRTEAYDTLIKYGESADSTLNDRVLGINAATADIAKALKDFDYEKAEQLQGELEKLTNPRELATLMLNLQAGGIANAGKQADADIQRVRDLFAGDLKELTPEEDAKLEDAHYRTARYGGLAEILAMLEIAEPKRVARLAAAERAAAVEEGRKKIDPETAARIERIKELTGTAGGPRVHGGPARKPADITTRLKSGDYRDSLQATRDAGWIV